MPADQFATVRCADDRGRAREYDLADTTYWTVLADPEGNEFCVGHFG